MSNTSVKHGWSSTLRTQASATVIPTQQICTAT